MQYHKYILGYSFQSFIYKWTSRHTYKWERDKELRIEDTLDNRFQIQKELIWTINGKNEDSGI